MTYDQIMDKVLACGSNSVSVFGGSFEGGYQLQQNPPEVVPFLLDLSKRSYKAYLEIGIAAGGLTRIMCDILDIYDVATLDLNIHPSVPLAYENNIKNLKHKGSLKQFIGDSHSADARKFLEDSGLKFDLMFIDGDHSYEGVKQDTLLALGFAEKGCLVAFHDHVCVGDIGRFDQELRRGAVPSLRFLKEYIGDSKKKGIVLYEVV